MKLDRQLYEAMNPQLFVDGMGHPVEVSIVRDRNTGSRFAKVRRAGGVTSGLFPVDVIGLAAGKDAWMRNILVTCRECRTEQRAGDLECELCPTCLEQAELENASLDGGAR